MTLVKSPFFAAFEKRLSATHSSFASNAIGLGYVMVVRWSGPASEPLPHASRGVGGPLRDPLRFFGMYLLTTRPPGCRVGPLAVSHPSDPPVLSTAHAGRRTKEKVRMNGKIVVAKP